MTVRRLSLILCLICAGGLSLAEDLNKTRLTAPIDQEAPAEPIADVVNSDIRQVRNYPDQPPIIPHKTDNYQLDLDANKCLSCHSRAAVEMSQAPMISVTHFMDRDGQTLATVSPRRYFCTQCHVTQTNAKPLVVNDFVDVDAVLDYVRGKQDGGE